MWSSLDRLEEKNIPKGVLKVNPQNRIDFPVVIRYTMQNFADCVMAVPEERGEHVVTTNRKARHDYTVLETVEAGIALKGTEVKSLRQGNANLTDGYAHLKNGEVWLHGMHVSPYAQASYTNVDPLRDRKLLLHKKEIRKLAARTAEKGLTLIPLKVYFKKSIAKVLLGVCRGKREYDRRHDIAEREIKRDIRRRYAR